MIHPIQLKGREEFGIGIWQITIPRLEIIKNRLSITSDLLGVLKNLTITIICANGEIAEKLFISTTTVDTHRKNLLAKFDTRNTTPLIWLTVQMRLI